MAHEIEELREHTSDFGVNLFVPSTAPIDAHEFASYARGLRTDASALEVTLSEEPVTQDDDDWDAKIAYLVEHPVPVVSFVFGLPAQATDIRALKDAGSRVLATVTQPAEALAAARAGVSGLVVQGPNAGGHSAIFDPTQNPSAQTTTAALAAVAAVTDLPLIAAGGVNSPESVRELLAAGAHAVAIGTLLLRTDEAGTSATHRAALASPQFDETVITRAFTGRPARALRNGFIDAHSHEEITAYPAVHHLTRELRLAAGRACDAHGLHLWAGTGFAHSQEGPAAAVIERLAAGIM